MKRRAFGLTLSLLVLAGLAPLAGAEPSQVQEELQGIYTRVADRIKSGEDAPAAEYIHPAFKLRDLHGKDVPLSEVRQRHQKSIEKTESISKLAIDVKRVVTRGDLALVLATRRAVARLKGPKDTHHDFTSTAWALDLWEKRADGWKLRRVEMLSLQQTLDGKPVRLDIGLGGKPPRRKPAARPDADGTPVRVALVRGDAGPEPDTAPESGTFQVAQVYVTPYSYGWSGVSTVVGMPQYSLGPGGYMTGAQSARFGGSYNLSSVAGNRAMLAQHWQYENYANMQRQSQTVNSQRMQQSDAKVTQQMQAYLAKQQPAGSDAGR